MLRAADIAMANGNKSTTVLEFGVASGNGIMNMISLAAMIKKETGCEFNIIGFDSGEGLFEPQDYRDHPEMWQAGDYPMPNRKEVEEKVQRKARIIFGDIKDTAGDFENYLDERSPLGFVSIDVDYYSSAIHALECLRGNVELYNPAISLYFDDISSFYSNEWCGELAAISKFNSESNLRKIDADREIHSRTIPWPWYSSMYVCHMLDHPKRNIVSSKKRPPKHIPANF
jgi:hypothetical protein